MAEPQIVNTLRTKQADLERQIEALERQLSETRVALGHVTAVLLLYEAGDGPHEFPALQDITRVVPRGLLWKMAKAVLGARGVPMTTREIADYIITEKGWDAEDRPLRTAITYRLVHLLSAQWKRGNVKSEGKVKGGVRVWTL